MAVGGYGAHKCQHIGVLPARATGDLTKDIAVEPVLLGHSAYGRQVGAVGVAKHDKHSLGQSHLLLFAVGLRIYGAILLVEQEFCYLPHITLA